MRNLMDLLLPPRCPGCKREGTVFCEPCAAPLLRRLGEPPGAPLGLPARLPADVVQLEWSAMYSGTVRDALHALKYGGEHRLVAPLAEALAEHALLDLQSAQSRESSGGTQHLYIEETILRGDPLTRVAIDELDVQREGLRRADGGRIGNGDREVEPSGIHANDAGNHLAILTQWIVRDIINGELTYIPFMQTQQLN